jgi:hypothetical protein
MATVWQIIWNLRTPLGQMMRPLMPRILRAILTVETMLHTFQRHTVTPLRIMDAKAINRTSDMKTPSTLCH